MLAALLSSLFTKLHRSCALCCTFCAGQSVEGCPVIVLDASDRGAPEGVGGYLMHVCHAASQLRL